MCVCLCVRGGGGGGGVGQAAGRWVVNGLRVNRKSYLDWTPGSVSWCAIFISTYPNVVYVDSYFIED